MNAKLQRYFQIRELIEQEPKKWTCGKLGVRFGISKQQIHRDIQQLRAIGLNIKSSSKGYRIEIEK